VLCAPAVLLGSDCGLPGSCIAATLTALGPILKNEIKTEGTINNIDRTWTNTDSWTAATLTVLDPTLRNEQNEIMTEGTINNSDRTWTNIDFSTRGARAICSLLFRGGPCHSQIVEAASYFIHLT
jgi:hypothetical protein